MLFSEIDRSYGRRIPFRKSQSVHKIRELNIYNIVTFLNHVEWNARGEMNVMIEELKRVVEKVSVNDTILEQHGRTLTYHKPSMPDVVVFPRIEEELVGIVEVARKYKKPIVPYGVGTSLEAQTIPYYSGIVVDFSEMNQILAIRPEDFTVTVQPGVCLLYTSPSPRD